MPTMANITVKKFDGVTDAVYTAVTPEGGPQSPATWEYTAMAAVRQDRARLMVSSAPNVAQTGRRVKGTFRYPYTVVVGGVNVRKEMVINVDGFADIAAADSVLQEAGAQLGNLLASTLIKSVWSSGGFAPT